MVEIFSIPFHATVKACAKKGVKNRKEKAIIYTKKTLVVLEGNTQANEG
jgi:hypothetical protein